MWMDHASPAAAVASRAPGTLTHRTRRTHANTNKWANTYTTSTHTPHAHFKCTLQDILPCTQDGTHLPPAGSCRPPPQRNRPTTASQHATPRHVSRHVMFARSPIPHHRHQPSARCRRSTIVRPAARGGRGPAETTKGKARRAGGGNAMTMGEGFRSESNISHGDKVSTTRSTVGISPQSRQGGGNAMALAMGEPCLK